MNDDDLSQLVYRHKEDLAVVMQAMFGQPFIQPIPVIAPQLQILGEEMAVADEQEGEAGFLHRQLEILGGGGLLGGIGENGQASVGL